MRSLKGRIKSVYEAILKKDPPAEPTVATHHLLDSFKEKMVEYGDNFTYYNRIEDLNSSIEVLGELTVFVMMAYKEVGMYDDFEAIVKAVADDIVLDENKQYNADDFPIVMPGTDVRIDIDDNEYNECSDTIDKIIENRKQVELNK
jgi:hypothetical protein